MPRTALSVGLLPRVYDSANLNSGNPINVPFTAMDTVNGNKFPSTGRELLLVYNPNVGEATFTIKAVDDRNSRSVDIVNKFLQGTLVIGPIDQEGFLQTDGNVYVDGTSGLQIAVLRLARTPL